MHPGAKLIFFGHKYYTKSEHTYFSVGVLDFFLALPGADTYATLWFDFR
jgi:hypothetical protein